MVCDPAASWGSPVDSITTKQGGATVVWPPDIMKIYPVLPPSMPSVTYLAAEPLVFQMTAYIIHEPVPSIGMAAPTTRRWLSTRQELQCAQKSCSCNGSLLGISYKGVRIFIEDWLYSWLYGALPYVSLIYVEAYDGHAWVQKPWKGICWLLAADRAHRTCRIVLPVLRLPIDEGLP